MIQPGRDPANQAQKSYLQSLFHNAYNKTMKTIFIIKDLKQGRWIRKEDTKDVSITYTSVIELAKTFSEHETAKSFSKKLPPSYYQIEEIFVI